MIRNEYQVARQKIILLSVLAMILMTTAFVGSTYFFTIRRIEERVSQSRLRPTTLEISQPDSRWKFSSVRNEAITNLLVTQLVVLICGTLLSYKFSEKILRPINNAQKRQAEFTENAHHQLKTPLATLHATIENRQLRADSVEEKHYLQSLLSEVETIDHTTRRLLEFSLSRSNDRDKYVSKQEINDVVAKAAEQYKVAVTVQIDSSLPMGHDDLRLIIDSLLSNVSKHSGEHHPPARVRVSARKSMYILSCQNKGKKFTKNALVHATKRGFTTSGSGIGLSLCAELVENLRGNIKLLNNASGVEVRINIPRIR